MLESINEHVKMSTVFLQAQDENFPYMDYVRDCERFYEKEIKQYHIMCKNLLL